MIDRALKFVYSYDVFKQGQLLRQIAEKDEKIEGICLSLCYAWFKLHIHNPNEKPKSRLNLLKTKLRVIKEKHMLYLGTQRRMQEILEYNTTLLTVGNLLINNEYLDEGIILQDWSKERKVRYDSLFIKKNNITIPPTLIQHAKRMKVKLNSPEQSIIDLKRIESFIELVLRFKSANYWLLSLGRSHAICIYSYHSKVFKDYIICFDPNFGEFKIFYKHNNAALFFHFLIRDVPEYMNYKKCLLYKIFI